MEDDHFEKEKKCHLKRERANKQLFISSHDPKTAESRAREISRSPDFSGICQKRGEKRSS